MTNNTTQQEDFHQYFMEAYNAHPAAPTGPMEEYDYSVFDNNNSTNDPADVSFQTIDEDILEILSQGHTSSSLNLSSA